MHAFKYTHKKISQDFIIFNQFYFFGIKVFEDPGLKEAINKLKGLNISYIEKRKWFGRGYSGVSAEADSLIGEKIHIEGEFNMVEFVGSHKELQDFLKKLKRENPLGKNWMNLYLNMPKDNSENVIAWVLFKNVV